MSKPQYADIDAMSKHCFNVDAMLKERCMYVDAMWNNIVLMSIQWQNILSMVMWCQNSTVTMSLWGQTTVI